MQLIVLITHCLLGGNAFGLLLCTVVSLTGGCRVRSVGMGNEISLLTTAIGNAIAGVIKLLIDGAVRLVNWFCEWIDGRLNYRVIIPIGDRQNPRGKRAVFAEIVKTGAHIAKGDAQAMEYGYIVEAVVRMGTYELEDDVLGAISAEVSEAEIVLRWKRNRSPREEAMTPKQHELAVEWLLFDYYQRIHAKHNRPDRQVEIVFSMTEKWGDPAFRKPRNMTRLPLTAGLAAVMADVDLFFNEEHRHAEYEMKGHPWKRGYLLHGPPGTGKSLVAELIAVKYGGGVYMVTLDAKDMSDSALIQLIAAVPPRSIIVFDEIDKQLAGLVSIKLSGLFSAIDGPQRLSNGTIVIFTSNTRWFLGTPALHQAFERRGRVEGVFCLDQPFGDAPPASGQGEGEGEVQDGKEMKEGKWGDDYGSAVAGGCKSGVVRPVPLDAAPLASVAGPATATTGMEANDGMETKGALTRQSDVVRGRAPMGSFAAAVLTNVSATASLRQRRRDLATVLIQLVGNWDIFLCNLQPKAVKSFMRGRETRFGTCSRHLGPLNQACMRLRYELRELSSESEIMAKSDLAPMLAIPLAEARADSQNLHNCLAALDGVRKWLTSIRDRDWAWAERQGSPVEPVAPTALFHCLFSGVSNLAGDILIAMAGDGVREKAIDMRAFLVFAASRIPAQ